MPQHAVHASNFNNVALWSNAFAVQKSQAPCTAVGCKGHFTAGAAWCSATARHPWSDAIPSMAKVEDLLKLQYVNMEFICEMLREHPFPFAHCDISMSVDELFSFLLLAYAGQPGAKHFAQWAKQSCAAFQQSDASKQRGFTASLGLFINSVFGGVDHIHDAMENKKYQIKNTRTFLDKNVFKNVMPIESCKEFPNDKLSTRYVVNTSSFCRTTKLWESTGNNDAKFIPDISKRPKDVSARRAAFGHLLVKRFIKEGHARGTHESASAFEWNQQMVEVLAEHENTMKEASDRLTRAKEKASDKAKKKDKKKKKQSKKSKAVAPKKGQSNKRGKKANREKDSDSESTTSSSPAPSSSSDDE